MRFSFPLPPSAHFWPVLRFLRVGCGSQFDRRAARAVHRLSHGPERSLRVEPERTRFARPIRRISRKSG